MNRPSRDDIFMADALSQSLRATCVRRQVGCVLVNERGHILSTGFNGNAAGEIHCIDVPCFGVHAASGHSLAECDAIHAEQNALEQCQDVWTIHTVYVTASPCRHCIKMLKNTSAVRIVYGEIYSGFEKSRGYWLRENKSRVVKRLPPRVIDLYQGSIRISIINERGNWERGC